MRYAENSEKSNSERQVCDGGFAVCIRKVTALLIQHYFSMQDEKEI